MARRFGSCDDVLMPKSVLIVDDHPSFRATAQRLLLEAEGFTVVGEAVDGREALRKAKELHPDIVLLDVQLPDIDGFEVAAGSARNGGCTVDRARLEPRRRRLRRADRRRAAPAASCPRAS